MYTLLKFGSFGSVSGRDSIEIKICIAIKMVKSQRFRLFEIQEVKQFLYYLLFTPNDF